MENRIILGIDNSIDYLNIVLSREDSIIEERCISSSRTPSGIIAVETADILSNNGYSVGDIGMIVATVGPGSFTGIRVALAFCKGISSGRGIPIVGVPTLDVLASSFVFMEGYHVCPLIDAKKGEVFCSLYRISNGKSERLTDYIAVRPEKVREIVKIPFICFGTGAGLCRQELSLSKGEAILVQNDFERVTGSALVKEGIKRVASNTGNSAVPIYGRKSEAEIKFNITLT